MECLRAVIIIRVNKTVFIKKKFFLLFRNLVYSWSCILYILLELEYEIFGMDKSLK